MSPSDFLHHDAETQLSDRYVAAGAVCSISTNSEHLLAAAHDTFLPTEKLPASLDFTVRFWVDDADPAQPPWPKPYVRGLGHLVFAGFDAGSSMLADLRTRHVIGRFSPGMAADTGYWKTVIFPMMLTIVAASVGIAELHCACVGNEQNGILLAGPSGSGKSTLALAMSQMGFRFLSDDRTFCSVSDGKVTAWGLPTRLKLRPESRSWFQEMRNAQPTDTVLGEQEFWCEPEHFFSVERARQCRPRAVIFLERHEASEFQLTRMSSSEALNRLSRDLIAESSEASDRRSRTLEEVVELPCWLLQYGGIPQTIAQNLAQHFAK